MVGFAVLYLGVIVAHAGVVVGKVIPRSRCDTELCLRNKYCTKRPQKTDVHVPVSPIRTSALSPCNLHCRKALVAGSNDPSNGTLSIWATRNT